MKRFLPWLAGALVALPPAATAADPKPLGLAEAAEWARHFGQLEKDMDSLLAELFGAPAAAMDKWINPGRYVSGRDLVEAGLAEMIDLKTFRLFERNGAMRDNKKRAKAAH